jgi:hypothetical protein
MDLAEVKQRQRQAWGQGPMSAALRRVLSEDQQKALREEQLELVRDWAGGEGPISIEAEYLLIVARKPG